MKIPKRLGNIRLTLKHIKKLMYMCYKFNLEEDFLCRYKVN